MGEQNKKIFDELDIKTSSDLKRYVLVSLLELSRSEKVEHKILALREISKYLFSASHYQFISDCLKDG